MGRIVHKRVYIGAS